MLTARLSFGIIGLAVAVGAILGLLARGNGGSVMISLLVVTAALVALAQQTLP